MRKIPLSQGKFALVNTCDYIYLMQWKWHYNHSYAVRGQRISGRVVKLHMHREILKRMGFTSFQETDHKNRDRLDNRRANLRPATSSQNKANRASQKQFKGVFWDGSRKCWQSQITSNYRKYHLGYFDSAIKAALAYNQAAKKYFGDFARLNEL